MKNNVLKHLIIICTHKFYVAKYCFKFRLYQQGIFHDLSKFNPREFWTSVKYYQGNRSPIEAEKEDKGYSLVWLHHFHNNPHHWAYWIDFDMQQNLTPYKMPYKYVIESVCDSIAAGITYSKKTKKKYEFKDTYIYYRDHIRINNKVSEKIFHKDTRQLFDIIYFHLMKHGIEKVLVLYKEGYYRKLYDLLESTQEIVVKNLNTEYDEIVKKYYTSEDEFKEQFEIDINNIIQVMNSFITPNIKQIKVSEKFYSYLQTNDYLEYNKKNLTETFYEIPIIIISSKCKPMLSFLLSSGHILCAVSLLVNHFPCHFRAKQN